MPITRREALPAIGLLLAAPLACRPGREPLDPLAGTIADFQAGRVRGDWTSLEVTQAAIARGRSLATLRAVDLWCDTAPDEARASDERLAAGALRGPLDGVPVFAKSIHDIAGLPTTASSAEWARLFPEAVPRDAVEVARMRAAGAVVLGKTAADDFAYRGNGTSSLTGQVLNPHDPMGVKTPGGSSAGTAVAVACGIAFAGLGTDDGGSNRIPAQFTGVVGMKPTFGLVPRTGVIPTWPYLDTHGPLARTVADAAILLAAIAGPDPDDALALTGPYDPAPLLALPGDALRGARLGLVEAHVPRDRMPAETLAMVERAVADLRAAGATVVPFETPVDRHNVQDLFAEAAAAAGDVEPSARPPAATANALLRYFERHEGDARAMVARGLAPYQAFYDVLPTDSEDLLALAAEPYEKSPAGQAFARARAVVVARLADAMAAAGLDAMIYPTMPFPAPRAVDDWPDIRTPLGYGNWTGLPEVSVPAGLGADGMPSCNLSFVGPWLADARVLALAHGYERASNRFAAPSVG